LNLIDGGADELLGAMAVLHRDTQNEEPAAGFGSGLLCLVQESD
jgi:hypothetical protein